MTDIDITRQLQLYSANESGSMVVYVMSRDQRVRDNFALLAAQRAAMQKKVPLLVLFNVLPRTGWRAQEHIIFMLQGLENVAASLGALNIPFIMTSETSSSALANHIATLDPAEVYFDFSPLAGPRKWAKNIAKILQVNCFVVDTHNIIPAWVGSDHQEFAAHTFRRKVHRHLGTYLVEPEQTVLHPYKSDRIPNSIGFDAAYSIAQKYPNRSIGMQYTSGEDAAHRHLELFISSNLETYALGRNDIADDKQSGLSPYLHFGQISSLRVALEVLHAAKTTPLLLEQPKMASAGNSPSLSDGMNALFEEMIVRKELSDNFCLYTPDYLSIAGAPAWALDSLNQHLVDERTHTYSYEEFENAKTHDESWNAAQRELTRSGKIHGYMRMYWAKKILEWTQSPEQALDIAIQLNDSYSIDGGDPNGYVGILWSIAGLHDRPWTERPIFGKVRYMNEAGLRRKFDVNAYIRRNSQ